MSRHEGVSCDSCLKGNFKGKRYKCLICYDYDLCSTCYEAGATTTRHSTDHPMQCIITRSDYDLYYGGEALPLDQTQSFACPHCGQMGFTEVTLQEHVSSDHSDASNDVVCPVCATMPGGEPNHVTDDLVSHLSIEHRNTRDMEEASSSRQVRRIPHPGRGMSRARAHLSQMQFTAPGIGLSSPSNRDTTMDPIAELLSQLSGVRRAANLAQTSTTSQLQQLQMQLQMERQQVQSARQQLERLPRRNLSSNNNNSLNTSGGAGTSSLVAGGSSVLPAQFQFGTSSNPSTSTQQPAPVPPPPSKSSSQFLLSKYLEPTLSESEQNNIDIERADRSMFVQELLLSSLMESLSIDEIIRYSEDSHSNSSTTNSSTNINSDKLKEDQEDPTSNQSAIVQKPQDSNNKQTQSRSQHLKPLPLDSNNTEVSSSTSRRKHQKERKSLEDSSKSLDPPPPH